MEKIDLKTFKPRNGWVLVQPIIDGVDAYTETSFGRIQLDSDIENHKNMGVVGKVYAVCSKLHNMEWEADIDIKKGDLIWYNWHTIGTAYQQEKDKSGLYSNRVYQDINDENIHVILMPYYQIFCKVGSEHVENWLNGTNKSLDLVEMINGYTLIEPEISMFTSDLDIDYSNTSEISKRIGFVRKIGKDNKKYLIEEREGMPYYPCDEMIDIKLGNRVLIDRNCNLPLEWDYQGTRAESIGGHYFRVQKRYLSMVLEEGVDVTQVFHKPSYKPKEFVVEDDLERVIRQETERIKESKITRFI